MSAKQTMEVRYIKKHHLEEVVEAENASHYRYDEDFEVKAMAPWSWTKGDFLSAIRQRKSHRNGTYETRTLVVEAEVDHEMKAVGAMVFELQDEGYEILKISVHPDFPQARKQLCKHIILRAQKSVYRKRVVIHIPDGDWENVKFFQSQGWEPKLRREYFSDGNDAWRCEYLAGGMGGKRDLASV